MKLTEALSSRKQYVTSTQAANLTTWQRFALTASGRRVRG